VRCEVCVTKIMRRNLKKSIPMYKQDHRQRLQLSDAFLPQVSLQQRLRRHERLRLRRDETHHQTPDKAASRVGVYLESVSP
jgi:hypothetical protein